MLIFDDASQAIIIDSVTTPITTDYLWVLDLQLMDYTLTPLLMLEETIAPTLTLQILGFSFKLPANWYILVYSEETMQLDVVHIGELAGDDFTAVVYGPNYNMVRGGNIKVVNYETEDINFGPALNKHQMLCHPIGPNEWVNVSPSDVYNKYLKERVTGDLLS